MVPKRDRIQPKASSARGEQEGKARGDLGAAHSTAAHTMNAHSVSSLVKHSRPSSTAWTPQTPPGTPSSPLPAPTDPGGCRRPPSTPSSHGQTPPGTDTAWGLRRKRAGTTPGTGGESPACPSRTCPSSPAGVLFFPVRADKPLTPSPLPVIPACWSCCWNWCNWNSLCWEGRAAPLQGPEEQLFSAPGHLQDTSGGHPEGQDVPLNPHMAGGQPWGTNPILTSPGDSGGDPRTVGWPGRGCGAFGEASESS